MKRNSYKLFILLFLITLLLSGCLGPNERQFLKSPGWSRAMLVGSTAQKEPVPMALDDSGMIYIIQIREEQDVDRPHLMALDRQGKIMWEKSLDVTLSSPKRPHLLWDGENLRLFWISSLGLYTSRVNTAGEMLGYPTLISREIDASTYSVAFHPEQGLAIWFAGGRQEPGVYALDGANLSAEPVQVDSEGISPYILFDQSGLLHAVWSHQPIGYGGAEFLYAAYPDGEFTPSQEEVLLKPQVSATSVLFGPWLAFDEQNVYLFWEVNITTGLQAGTLVTTYTYFPLGKPAEHPEPQTFFTPTDYLLDYVPASVPGLNIGQWALMDGSYEDTSALDDVYVNQTDTPIAMLIFHSQVQHQFRKIRGQVSIAYLQDGQPHGYQLLSFSQPNSVSPSLLAGNDGNLYVTWLEKGDVPGYLVYFASTAPDIAASLNRLDQGDLSRMAGETAFGLLAGIVMAPLGIFIWMILPLILLGITTPLRSGAGKGRMLGTYVSLGLAVAAFLVVKTASLPGMSSYVPFSAWIPVLPDTIGPLLRFLVPVLIGIIALVAAWRFTFYRDSQTSLYFLLIFAAVDGVLTMAIYGVLILGAL